MQMARSLRLPVSGLRPAPAGVQALTINSLRSAWTPVLAVQSISHRQTKPNSEARNLRDILSIELVQNIGLVNRSPPKQLIHSYDSIKQ